MATSDFDDIVPDKLWDDIYETSAVDGLSAEQLDDFVHTLLSRRLVEALQSGHGSTIPAGTFNAGLRFLKDNDITSLAVPGSAHEALKKKMSEKLPFTPKITGTD